MIIFVLLVGGCGVFLFSLGSGVGAKKNKTKKKQEMLQYVTNAPRRSLIMTLIPGCDLEHSQGTSLAQDVTCHFVLLFCVTLTLGKEP